MSPYQVGLATGSVLLGAEAVNEGLPVLVVVMTAPCWPKFPVRDRSTGRCRPWSEKSRRADPVYQLQALPHSPVEKQAYGCRGLIDIFCPGVIWTLQSRLSQGREGHPHSVTRRPSSAAQ